LVEIETTLHSELFLQTLDAFLEECFVKFDDVFGLNVNSFLQTRHFSLVLDPGFSGKVKKFQQTAVCRPAGFRDYI
jgi:hypothetical protein